MIINELLIGGMNLKECTAVASDVLENDVVYTTDGRIVGTMQNNGAINHVLTTNNQTFTIPAGYHDGNGFIKLQMANLTSENILSGVTIAGVKGNYYVKKKFSNCTVRGSMTINSGASSASYTLRCTVTSQTYTDTQATVSFLIEAIRNNTNRVEFRWAGTATANY